MAVDMQEVVRNALKNATQSAGGTVESARDSLSSNGSGAGLKGLAAGAGAAALAPVAFKGATKLAKGLSGDGLGGAIKSPGEALGGVTSSLGDRVSSTVKDKIDDAGGPSGIMKDAAKSMLPFGGGGDEKQSKGKGGAPGAGKGRRMPVQQSMDIGLPIETVYNQWTQFEEWPNFMHRVTRVTQEDDCTLSFAVKIWGKTKEFTAEIETQRPDERIKWRVSQGMDHTGVVSFHELGPNLTRVLIGLDVKPGGLLEKFARGARHVKRAARGDLHRFKGFVEMAERETGAWRGVIEDGEVVEEHDSSYDKQRDYADIEELLDRSGSDDDDDNNNDDGTAGDEEKTDRQKSRGGTRAASGQRSSRQSRSQQGGEQSGQRRSRQSAQSSSRRGESGRSRQNRGRGESTSGGGRSRGGRTASSRRSSSSRQSS